MAISKVIDNKRKILLNELRAVSSRHEYLSIATGYWDLEGMASIWKDIKDYKKIRILIGREPLLKRDNQNHIQKPEPDYPDEDFFNDLRNVPVSQELKELVLEIKDAIDKGKLEVRVYRRDFLHAKAYIFGSYESDQAVAFVGSSNFTLAGLTTNTELNTSESDHRIVTFKPHSEDQEAGYLHWFDELWNDELTEKWNGEFIELLRTAPVGDLLYSPYELYIRTLYETYKDYEEAEALEVKKGAHYTPKDFQQRSAKLLIHKLQKYKVAMLADSVGLGKTVTAMSVIRHYEGKRVVVITPASLKPQWEQELAKDEILNARVISLQNSKEIEVQKKIDKYIKVSLFVIDESHNLRNMNSQRYEQLFDWVYDNEGADVLMLTATPVNNSLDDLVNQVLLGARGDQDIFLSPYKTSNKAIETRSFFEIVENIKKQMNQNRKRLLNAGKNEQEIKEELQQIYEEARMIIDPIIRAFVVRNTRHSLKEEGADIDFPQMHIKNSKYLLPNLEGFEFSKLAQSILEKDPYALKDAMDVALHPLRQIEQNMVAQASEDDLAKTTMIDIYKLILSLGLPIYRWILYDTRLYSKNREEIKSIIESSKKDAQIVASQIGRSGFMLSGYLKRLESSPFALKQTLIRYVKKLEVFEKFLKEKDLIIPIGELEDIKRDILEDDFDLSQLNDKELEDFVNNSNKVVKKVSERFKKEELLEDINLEKNVIEELLRMLDFLTEKDLKFKQLKQFIVESYKQNPNQKILIFSSYSDTIKYLKNKLQEQAQNDKDLQIIIEKAAFVSGANRDEALKAADLFSPNARGHEITDQEQEINYLFATDVLSEGQNLQDAQVVVNYDLHWNPVRMIQRSGRINRIGSPHKEIFVYNFLPNDELESLLGLVKAIEQKIELMRITVGTDTQVLDEEIDPRAYIGIYSEDEKEALKTYESIEFELESFADDEFVADLKQFLRNADEKLKRKVLRIPYNSWTRHNYNYDGAYTNISAAKATFDDGTEKILYFSSQLTDNPNEFYLEQIPHVLAFKQIKVTSEQSVKPADTIDPNLKQLHIDYMKEAAPNIAGLAPKDSGLKLTDYELMEIAKNNGLTEQDLYKLEKLATTRNVKYKKEYEKLKRKIRGLEKIGESTNDYIQKLQKLLDKIDEIDKEPRVQAVDPAFMFVDNND